MLDASVGAVIRDALGDAPTWLELRNRIERAAPEGEEERYRPFVFAFGYALIAASHRERREREGGPFGAMIAQGNWSFPPPLGTVLDADIALWAEAIDQLEGPVAHARLHDLLWERRVQPRPDLHARAAISALVELVDLAHWHVMERTTCLARAMELANTINDPDLRARSTARAVIFIEEVIAREERGPGAALTILRAFVDMRAEHRPAELPVLMASSAKRFGDDPHIFDSLSELNARLVDDDQQLEIRRQQVTRWRSEATKGDTMLRVIRLEQALEIARTYGLTTEADEIRRELQNIRPEDLELETISATAEIPSDAVEEWIGSIADQPDWREALRHFGSEGPPGGSDEDIEQQLATEREEFVFTRLFTRTVVGRDNAATRFRVADDASRDKLERSERRAFHARMMSGLYARALLTINKRHPRPDHAALGEFFATEAPMCQVVVVAALRPCCQGTPLRGRSARP